MKLIGKAEIRWCPDDDLYMGKVVGSPSGYATREEAKAQAKSLSAGRQPAKAVTKEQDRFYLREVFYKDMDLGGLVVPLDTSVMTPDYYASYKLSVPEVLEIVDDQEKPIVRGE